MDLDAQLRKLHKWKDDVEKLLSPPVLAALLAIANAQTAGTDPAGATALPPEFEDLKAHVVEIGEHVTALEQKFDGLSGLGEKLDSVLATFDQLKPQLAAVEKLADPAVLDLLNWLAGEREALTVLLSIADNEELDEGVGTGTSEAQSGTGAVSEADPTKAPPPPDGATDGSEQPQPGGTGQPA